MQPDTLSELSGAKEIMNTVLILRTCSADLTSYAGFRWPASGPVEAPDWNPAPVCGGGLHGLLWGEGSVSYMDLSEGAKWLVFRASAEEVTHGAGDMQDKCKARRGVVEFCGNRDGAVAYLLANGAAGRAVVFGTATAGYRGTATAGYGGTATAGDEGTATAGYRGTATAGDGGEIRIRYWDGKRYRTRIGYIGEDGLEPNKKYRLNGDAKFVEVK
jgi:hypothetical protein